MLPAIVAILTAVSAYAQDSGLKGLKEFSTLVAVDQAGATCGLSEAQLEQAFMAPTSSEKFKIVRMQPLSSMPFMEITTLSAVLNQGVTCISAVTLHLIHVQKVRLNYNNEVETAVEVLIWRHHKLLSSPRSAHAKRMTDAVENAAKEFVIEWNVSQSLP